MRFSAVTVLAAVAATTSVSAFVPSTGRNQISSLGRNGGAFAVSSRSSATRQGAMSMDLSDLESKLLSPPEPVKSSGKAERVKVEKPKKESKKEKAA
eukprot:11585858-Ditylum_brightwellii.AAC.1